MWSRYPYSQGHLIASRHKSVSCVTFVFTNSFPQFGSVNSGPWNWNEERLLDWAANNCQNAPLHTIVGLIPSTYGKNDKRFFGEAGFSNYEGPSMRWPRTNSYRINLVSFVYTAACCQTALFTKNTAFYSRNLHSYKMTSPTKLSGLFRAMNAKYVDLFPGKAKCTDDKHFIPL